MNGEMINVPIDFSDGEINWTEIANKPQGLEEGIVIVNPIYKIDTYCLNADQISLNPTCLSKTCFSGLLDIYYRCDGICPSHNLFTESSLEPQTCNNELLGYLVEG